MVFTKSNDAGPRVAVVGGLNTRGGVQSVIFSLVRGLNQRGITPDILWDIPPNPEMLFQEQVRVSYRQLRFPVPSNTIDPQPDSLAYLLRLLNTVRAGDLVDAYDFFYVFYNGFLLPGDVPHLRYLSGPPLLPQLVSVSPGLRGLPFRLLRGLYQLILRRLLPAYEYHRDNRYVINSQYTAGLFEEAHGVRLPVVYPPIALSQRSFTDGDLAHRDSITFFSRVVSYKRPDLVIRLASRFPHLRCVIMGSVPEHRQPYWEKLQVLAREVGRPDIVFLATPTNERVQAELARTRFYIFPGVNEHFGMTTPEAIASGAIPYVHDSGGQREIVTDDRLRFQDEDDFFERFAALESLPEQDLNEIRHTLRAHVDQYSQEAFIRRMLEHLPRKAAAHTARGERAAIAATGKGTS